MFRLLQDANLSSDAQNHALESLKSKLNQTKTLLREEREQMEAAKWEAAQRESQLQAEKEQLSEALAGLQKQLGFQQMKLTESQSAMRSAQNENQLLRKEYEDYKLRAAGILQVSWCLHNCKDTHEIERYLPCSEHHLLLLRIIMYKSISEMRTPPFL